MNLKAKQCPRRTPEWNKDFVSESHSSLHHFGLVCKEELRFELVSKQFS